MILLPKMLKHATLSACGQYRYWLQRTWGECGKGFCNFIMLNPSTADATIDDPTIRKCIGFAKRWGYEGMHVVNLFAFRATDPDELYKTNCPIGALNDDYIEGSLLSADRTIVAWGKHGSYLGRDVQVMSMLAHHAKGRTFALKLNGDGSPRHPLYVPYDVEPVVFGGDG